jgi:hypothetical protein
MIVASPETVPKIPNMQPITKPPIRNNNNPIHNKWIQYLQIRLFEYEYNIIDITNGKLLLDEWIVCNNFDIYFGKVGDYTKIAVEIKTNYEDEYEYGVDLESKYNLINKNGELLLDKWCDEIYAFNFDYAKVRLRDRYNLIN